MTTFGPSLLTTTLLTLTLLPGVTCRCRSDLDAVQLMTFNADLSPTISRFETRRTQVADALGRSYKYVKYDLMCLQGLWHEEDMKTVIDKFNFAIHYSPIHSSIGDLGSTDEETAPCTSESIDKLTACAGKCSEAGTTLKCLTEKCTELLFGLPDDCRACVGVSLNPRSKNVQGDLSRCTEKKRNNRINRSGLLVLSNKTDITNEITSKYHQFHEDADLLFERGYLHGNFTTDTGKTLEYACTHLSGYAPDYYEKRLPNLKSYEEQQAEEIDKLLANLKSRNVLLGCLNTGPESNRVGYDKLTAFWPDNYRKFRGYYSDYLENDGRCTYCQYANAVLRETLRDHEIRWSGQNLLDHVLTSNVNGVQNTAYQTLGNQVSDHSGVRLEVCL